MTKNIYKKGIVIIGILILFLPFINSTNAIEEKTIIVYSPSGGQTIRLDSTYKITWEPPMYWRETYPNSDIWEYVPFKFVTILLFQELTQITSIHMCIPNTGEYTWNISSEDYRIGDNYRLKIIAYGDYGNYGYSGFFSIKGPKVLTDLGQFFVDNGTLIVIIIIVIVLSVAYDFRTKKRILKFIRRR